MIVSLNRVRRKIVPVPILVFFYILCSRSDHIDLNMSFSDFSTCFMINIFKLAI